MLDFGLWMWMQPRRDDLQAAKGASSPGTCWVASIDPFPSYTVVGLLATMFLCMAAWDVGGELGRTAHHLCCDLGVRRILCPDRSALAQVSIFAYAVAALTFLPSLFTRVSYVWIMLCLVASAVIHGRGAPICWTSGESVLVFLVSIVFGCTGILAGLIGSALRVMRRRGLE